MFKANESDNDLARACTISAKSGSDSFRFSRMLSWKRAVFTDEDLMRLLSAIIRDFIVLGDSDASENNNVDILNYLCTV